MSAMKGSGVLSGAGASSLKAPRFEQGDGEKAQDGASKSLSVPPWGDSKVATDKLDSLQMDTNGVDVDPRSLQGRRGSRGFTVSTGTNNAQADMAPLRSGKRAQTMPATGTRRGDFVLTEDALMQLVEKNKDMQARKRRGSVSIGEVISDNDILKCWQEETTCHVHGIMSEGQSHMDEREWFFAHEPRKLPGKEPPLVACQKGSKGFRDTQPNQDNFSITYFKNGFTLACAFDGHGPFGHIVSHRTVQTVPYYLAKSSSFPRDIKSALIEAFETAQADLVGHALQNQWDVQASGSTAIACLWKGNKVWTANAGDSRAVIGTEIERKLVFETTDHKPNSEQEKSRIEGLGGEVRSKTYPDGWVNHRIFVKGQTYPGLCMARTFGDESVKAHGVIATPEVEEVTVDMKNKPFLILASDGVWEFMDSQFVVRAMSKKIVTDGPKVSLQKLQREAQKRWKDEEGDYCDDITSILVPLR